MQETRDMIYKKTSTNKLICRRPPKELNLQSKSPDSKQLEKELHF